MIAFPPWPYVQKGGLAVYDRDERGAEPKIIVFQYNPEQVRRTLANRAPPREPGNAAAAREDVRRVMGPPLETLTLSVTLNATDQMIRQHLTRDPSEKVGLHPALATLELLLYPKVARLLENRNLANRGEAAIVAETLPLTLLIWGRSRVVPVLLTAFSVTEEFFDTELNPVRAKVDLTLRVLTFMELPATSQGYDVYLTYQERKERLANQAPVTGREAEVQGFIPPPRGGA